MSLDKIENNNSFKENFRKKLNIEDFEDYERIVEESDGIISWEKLEKYSKFNYDWSIDWIYWEWDLDLMWKPISNLKYLKKVFWELKLDSKFIKSLPNLEYTKWSLSLYFSKVESLPKLEEVWGGLSWKNIKYLQKLKSVWWSLFLRENYIKNLQNLRYVWFHLNLNKSSIKSLPNLKYVWAVLNLNWTFIKNLSKLKYVWSDLDLSWIPKISLKNILKEIKKNSPEIWWKIIYDWMELNSYISWNNFLSYIENFEDENIDDKLLESFKEKFINRYWDWKSKRDDSIKKELNTIVTIIYINFTRNFLKYRESISLMIENWISQEELNKKINEKLDTKFHEIKYYFWEETKNRFLDEFQKEIKELNLIIEKNNLNENKLSSKENLKQKLNPEEFNDYEKMVEESDGIISWEKLEDFTRFNKKWFIDWIYWKWDLDLMWKPISNLKYLKKIFWRLKLNSEFITSLPNLEYVKWSLSLYLSKVESLPKLKKVWWWLNWKCIKGLPELKSVWSNLHLVGNPIKSLPKLEKVWFSLRLEWSSIKSLPKLEYVWGNLNLTLTFIESLPKLKTVGSILSKKHKIRNLPELEYVQWDLNLNWSFIKDLPKLKYVWGNLDLTWTYIEILPKLEEVWEDLILNWIPKNILESLLKEIIERPIKIWWKTIYDWTGFKNYIDIYYFLNYLENFRDKTIYDNILNDNKKEFINRYWIWRAKRDEKTKKELNILANIFFYKFMDNFITEVEKIKLMKNDWASEKEIEVERYKIDEKLDNKFHEIWHYFWEEIKNRLLDEFRKEMKEINQN